MKTRSTDWQAAAARIRAVATARGRKRAGAFAVEGTRLVERALRAGGDVEGVVVSQSYHAGPDERSRALLLLLRDAGVPVAVCPDAAMAEWTGGRDYGHILARVKLPDGASAFARPFEPGDVWVVAVDILDAGNIGAMVRSAHAGGARGLIATGVSDPWHPKAARTSMGSIFRLPVLHHPDAVVLLGQLRERGMVTLGASCVDGHPLPGVLTGGRPVALVMGSEAFGLPDSVLLALDERIRIPMADRVDSYSVNAATAILLYELMRGRI